MFNQSRIDIYDYLYNLFFNVVTKNVYAIREPQELIKSDTDNGFIVIRVGDIIDEGEFNGESYAYARCYIEAFIPPISRGRLDYDKYHLFEDSITEVIKQEAQSGTSEIYSIDEDSVLSSDIDEISNANNSYFLFVKSFVVNIFNIEE